MGAMARGPLMLRPSQRLMRGMDTVVFTATVLALAMVDTALALAMAMERGPLMLMPTTVTEAFMALAMEVMAMVDSTDMARGPLMLRPSQRLTPGTDTVASTDMERGPLMLTPSHGWDMVDSKEVGPMVFPPSWQPPPTTLPPRARGPQTL